MQVILTQDELDQCKHAASNRSNYARSSKIKNQRVDQSKSDKDVDYIGMVGELAVAKALGLDMDFEKVGVDYGIDFIYNNYTVDVKTRSYPNNDLVFKRQSAFKAEVAILAQFKKENCVNILGCMSRERFVKYAKPTHYDCLSASAKYIQPIEKLINNTKVTNEID
jgi:hypothetical protein